MNTCLSDCLDKKPTRGLILLIFYRIPSTRLTEEMKKGKRGVHDFITG